MWPPHVPSLRSRERFRGLTLVHTGVPREDERKGRFIFYTNTAIFIFFLIHHTHMTGHNLTHWQLFACADCIRVLAMHACVRAHGVCTSLSVRTMSGRCSG